MSPKLPYLTVALSMTALTACTDASAMKNLLQKQELQPHTAQALAATRFDSGEHVTIRGRVTTLLFGLPGTPGAMNIETQNGTEHYLFLTAGTRDMAKQGFSRFTIQPGQEVLVKGILANSGKRLDGFYAARADSIATSDGKLLFDRGAIPGEAQ